MGETTLEHDFSSAVLLAGSGVVSPSEFAVCTGQGLLRTANRQIDHGVVCPDDFSPVV